MAGHSDKVERGRRFQYGYYGFVSDRGLNPRRVTNEDSFLLLETIPLFAVADGVGGQNAGEVASQVTVEILKHYFLGRKLPGDEVKFLEQVVRYANRYLHEMALDDELLSGMATTLALLLLRKKQAIISHIGDSRIYQYSSGELRRLTTDHTIAEDRLFQGNREAGGNKNIITRALGVGIDVEPETTILPVEAGTAFLLCTDGIYRHINDEELAEVMSRDEDPQTVCNALKELCYQRGAKDNLTAVVVRIGSKSWFSGLSVPRGTDEDTRPASTSGQTRIHVQLPGHGRVGEESGDGPSGEDELLPWERALTDADSPQGRPAGRVFAVPRQSVPWLLAVLGLVVGFLAGSTFQRDVTPSSSRNQSAPPQSAAQRQFRQGRRAFESGQYQEARESFLKAVEIQPEAAEYHHWLGSTQMRLHEYRAAAETFHQAATLGRRSNDYLLAAAAYQALGDDEKANGELAAYLRSQQ